MPRTTRAAAASKADPGAPAVIGEIIRAPAAVSSPTRTFAELMAAADSNPYAADPVGEMLRCIQRASAMEAYLRERVGAGLESRGDEALTTVTDKGEEKVGALAVLLGEWSDRVANYSRDALRLGIEKKRIEDQQAVGAQFAKAVTELMYHPRLMLTADQRSTMHSLTLEVLSRMSGGAMA